MMIKGCLVFIGNFFIAPLALTDRPSLFGMKAWNFYVPGIVIAMSNLGFSILMVLLNLINSIILNCIPPQ